LRKRSNMPSHDTVRRLSTPLVAALVATPCSRT